MKKLIQGIVDFRHKVLPGYRETFARLALGQKPDALLVTCSDSRVAPNLFASTDPGDVFVLRNPGNFIPCCGDDGISAGDVSEIAAVEFALAQLEVNDIIVCGHSECGAIRAVLDGRESVTVPHLKSWLRHGEPALRSLDRGVKLDDSLSIHSQLSQLNVLQQIEHLKSYEIVQEHIRSRRLGIHGWWFDIAKGDVYAYEEAQRRFVLIDDEEAARLLKRLG